MKCPSCNKIAASFSEWGKGKTAFTHVCPHCETDLKASKGTITCFALALSTIPIVIPIALYLQNQIPALEGRTRLVGLTLFGAIIIPLAFLNWKFGSYALKTK